jgi:hypothetical protein
MFIVMDIIDYMILVGTLCVMHRCVKKHQNVRIRDPPVPHFSYVGIRDPPVPNNVIRKKKLVRIREPFVRGSNNHSVVGCATVKNRPIQHFFFIFKIREPSVLFSSGVSNSNSESENPRVPVILWNSCNEPKEPVL